MTFVAGEVALALIRSLRHILEQIERHDRPLADQARRAATSAYLNTEEGNQRRGRDRTHLFRIASGSTAELQAALRAAASWGYIDDPAEPLALADRLRGLLYGLVRRGCTSR